MSKICLVCFIGIPASGKTTFSIDLKKYLEECCDNCFHVELICFDDYEGFNSAKMDSWKSKRKEVFNDVLSIIEKFVKLSSTSNQNNLYWVILLDDNFYYRSMRYEYVQLAKSFNVGFCQIYLKTDLERSIFINQQRSNPIPDNIVTQMFEKIEEPNPSKFNWESKSVIYTYDKSLTEFLVKSKDLILSALLDPLINVICEITSHPSQSEIHLADLALRKVISYQMKNITKLSKNREFINKASLELSAEKQNILTCLKSGFVLLPDDSDFNEKPDKEKIKLYYDFFCTFFD